jgi:hypothetical protein
MKEIRQGEKEKDNKGKGRKWPSTLEYRCRVHHSKNPTFSEHCSEDSAHDARADDVIRVVCTSAMGFGDRGCGRGRGGLAFSDEWLVVLCPLLDERALSDDALHDVPLLLLLVRVSAPIRGGGCSSTRGGCWAVILTGRRWVGWSVRGRRIGHRRTDECRSGKRVVRPWVVDIRIEDTRVRIAITPREIDDEVPRRKRGGCSTRTRSSETNLQTRRIKLRTPRGHTQLHGDKLMTNQILPRGQIARERDGRRRVRTGIKIRHGPRRRPTGLLLSQLTNLEKFRRGARKIRAACWTAGGHVGHYWTRVMHPWTALAVSPAEGDCGSGIGVCDERGWLGAVSAVHVRVGGPFHRVDVVDGANGELT